MTPVLVDSLQVLLTHPTMMAAVQEVFQETIEGNRPEVGVFGSNDLLGEKYRAYEVSRQILKQAFDNLEKYRAPDKDKGEDTMHI